MSNLFSELWLVFVVAVCFLLFNKASFTIRFFYQIFFFDLCVPQLTTTVNVSTSTDGWCSAMSWSPSEPWPSAICYLVHFFDIFFWDSRYVKFLLPNGASKCCIFSPFQLHFLIGSTTFHASVCLSLAELTCSLHFMTSLSLWIKVPGKNYISHSAFCKAG